MFPRYRSGERHERDPSADPLGTTMHQKEQTDTGFVPGAAPVGHVRDYDEGRPKH